MPNSPPNFWNFSLDLYEREGVASACLELQSQYAFDVNLILLCYWYGVCYGELDERLFADIFSFSGEWHRQVVDPVRGTRTWMKQHAQNNEKFDELREEIKRAELAAEKYQQERIELKVTAFGEAASGTTGLAASMKNIALLLRAMDLDSNSFIEERLTVISTALER